MKSNEAFANISSLVGKEDTWKEGAVFCNIIGSSNDVPYTKPKEVVHTYAHDWVQTWLDVTGEKRDDIKCAVENCSEKDPKWVGGHVVADGSGVSPKYGDDGAFLVPICSEHNGKGYENVDFKLARDTKVVALHNYCRNAKNEELCKTDTSNYICGKGGKPKSI